MGSIVNNYVLSDYYANLQQMHRTVLFVFNFIVPFYYPVHWRNIQYMWHDRNYTFCETDYLPFRISLNFKEYRSCSISGVENYGSQTRCGS